MVKLPVFDHFRSDAARLEREIRAQGLGCAARAVYFPAPADHPPLTTYQWLPTAGRDLQFDDASLVLLPLSRQQPRRGQAVCAERARRVRSALLAAEEGSAPSVVAGRERSAGADRNAARCSLP